MSTSGTGARLRLHPHPDRAPPVPRHLMAPRCSPRLLLNHPAYRPSPHTPPPRSARAGPPPPSLPSIPHTATHAHRRPSPSGATSPARAPPRNPSLSPLPVLHRAQWGASPSCTRRLGDSARLRRAITRRALDRARSRCRLGGRTLVRLRSDRWLPRSHLQQGTTRRKAQCLDTVRTAPCQCVREAVEWSEAANSSNPIPLSFTLLAS
jgi:hypothetical protein